LFSCFALPLIFSENGCGGDDVWGTFVLMVSFYTYFWLSVFFINNKVDTLMPPYFMVVWLKYDLSWNIVFPFIYLSNINKVWSINLKINQHISIPIVILLTFNLWKSDKTISISAFFTFGHSRTLKLFVNFSTDDF